MGVSSPGRRRQRLIEERRRRHMRRLSFEAHMPAELRVRPRHRAPAVNLRVEALSPTASHALALAVLVTAGGALLNAALGWRVTTASVHGNVRNSAQQVFEASGLRGRHILVARPDQAALSVRSLPGVKSAAVRLSIPSHVSIDVQESRPVLVWRSEAGRFVIDEAGLALEPQDGADVLPEIEDRSALIKRAGDVLSPQLLETIMAYVRALPKGSALAYDQALGLVTLSEQGWPVYLGLDGHRAAGQVTLLSRLAEQLGQEGAGPRAVDLRFEGRPFVR
jgi:cell division septal protein FtsQ